MKTEHTSERLYEEDSWTNVSAYLLYLVHIATYQFSLNYINGKKVLDYGCGSGYGTAYISRNCLVVTGVDVSLDAIEYAEAHYNAPNLSYFKINKVEEAPLPFSDATFDVVLSFQVIEHVPNEDNYLIDLKRVLIPGGHIIIATPDRSSRLFSFQKPWNMWHRKEYSRKQLYKLMTRFFTNVTINQIGGKKEVIQIELNRTRKLKWIMLPFTLPFIPENIRISCIRLIKYLESKIIKRSNELIKPEFDGTSISISENENYSIDLIAVGKKDS